MKQTSTIVLVSILVVLGIAAYVYSPGTAPVAPGTTLTDPLNTTYRFDDATVTLVKGTATKEAAPGSAEKVTTQVFGEPVIGDLNGDGEPDAAVILVQSGAGSGVFYYAALAIKHGTTYTGTNVILIGDRIAPQTVEIHNGQAVYNYADRDTGEPMTAAPTFGKSLWVLLEPTSDTISEELPAYPEE